MDECDDKCFICITFTYIFFLHESTDLFTKAQNYYYLLKTTHLLRNRINMCEFWF